MKGDSKMKLSEVLYTKHRRLKRRIWTFGLLITGMLSLAFGLLTFYGYNAGNFVMSIDYDAYERGIILSDSIDFDDPKPRLMSDPVPDARDMTYSWLKLEEVVETDGNYKDVDYDYVAYTFYLKNAGNETVDVTYHIRITDNYKDLASGVRILIIDDGIETLYQLADIPNEFGEYPLYPVEIEDAEEFISDTIVMRNVIEGFEPDQIKKFTFVMWLEGEDPDTTDDILGGMIRLQMNFSINAE
jgi:hypothetical protein